jgi:eukaryotic-like serine/threonine-protein kinase
VDWRILVNNGKTGNDENAKLLEMKQRGNGTLFHQTKEANMISKARTMAALSLLAILVSACQSALQTTVPITGPTASRPSETATISATPTPGLGSLQVSPIDGMQMVFVPFGPFKMNRYGSDVILDGYWMDQTEVTNAMFAKFMRASAYVTDAEKNGGTYEYILSEKGDYFEKVEGVSWYHPKGENTNINGIENHPVVHVSWNDATAYCAWAERRLPTEAEWEKAASWNEQTSQKYRYPWGREFDGTLVNFCDQNCSVEWADKNFDDGYAETAPVGSYPKGASPYGALDMAGNVIEWVSDWFGPIDFTKEPVSNPKGPDSGEERVLRGGGWFTQATFTLVGNRISSEPDRPTYYTGFRCADTP